MKKSSIPPNLESEILAHAGEGWSTRRLSEWLLSEKGIEASHAAVGRLLARHRTERAEIAKAVVREKLSGTLTADLDRLEDLAQEAVKRAKEEPDNEVWAKLADGVRKITETKLKYSGAGEETDPGKSDPGAPPPSDPEVLALEEALAQATAGAGGEDLGSDG